MLMTPSLSTEDFRAALENYGNSPRASTASWTSSGRIYGTSSDTVLQTQILSAMHRYLCEFEASPSTANTKISDRKFDNSFSEGSLLPTSVAVQGVPTARETRLAEQGI